jgi:hypothetical protein
MEAASSSKAFVTKGMESYSRKQWPYSHYYEN